MKPGKKNSYNSLSDLEINNISYKFYSLAKAEQNGLNGIKKLPKSLKILLAACFSKKYEAPQNKSSLLGKIISIDKKTKNYELIFNKRAKLFSEKKLNQLCAAFELPDFHALLKKNEVFRCHPAKLAALRKYLLSIEHALVTGTEEVRSLHFLEQIEQEIAARVVSLIAESSQTVSRKPIRKRDNALKLAESYIFESGGEVVTIPELSIAANASQRTLEYAFHERYGCSPKAYTRIYRLNNVHKQLRYADPDTTQISDIALQHGFWHMGQFSADYKKLFAMLPSETLKTII